MFVGKVVATSAKVLVNTHLIVNKLLVVGNRAQIGYLLRFAVGAFHDIGISTIIVVAVALLHNVLSVAVNHNLRHSHIAIGSCYGWRKNKLVVGGHLQLVEVEGHRQRKLLVDMAHPYILHLYAAVGYGYTLALLPSAWTDGKC